MITIFSTSIIILSLIFWIITFIIVIKDRKNNPMEYLEKLLKEQLRHNKIMEQYIYNLNIYLREKGEEERRFYLKIKEKDIKND
jgi:hypothetical protein